MVLQAIASFQSTPSAWRETHYAALVFVSADISIHSLRMEGDSVHLNICRFIVDISIHSLRMEGDLGRTTKGKTYKLFQSTPSAWRETAVAVLLSCRRSFQSTPSAWRETAVLFLVPPQILISIHSLRMEGDVNGNSKSAMVFDFNPLPPHGGRLRYVVKAACWKIFQSTPSAWRETSLHSGTNRRTRISIHSLHTEGDQLHSVLMLLHQHFNPLPPHGGRLPRVLLVSAEMHFNPLPPHGGRRTRTQLSPIFHVFQSTPSTRRETTGSPTDSIYSDISIHSLHTEGDRSGFMLLTVIIYFNPLPPHGGRRFFIVRFFDILYFNPLPPHGGRLSDTKDDI